jgi:C-terminal processing protease CtpA/Prc
MIAPAKPQFTGRLWVLVGATNSSATFEFAQTVRQNRLGTLVGQPTGGNQRGINGGAFFFLRLPRSGIELDVPLIGQFPAGNPPDSGLQPDVLVVPTVRDIALGRDAELEAVRAHASRERGRRNVADVGGGER